jgi:hypothetical protein
LKRGELGIADVDRHHPGHALGIGIEVGGIGQNILNTNCVELAAGVGYLSWTLECDLNFLP